MTDLASALDAALAAAVTGEARVAGVAAAVTNRSSILFEGARGVRSVDSAEPMSPDTVVALYSCSKPVGATAALMLHDDGVLDLDAPARTYLPELGELGVLDGYHVDGSPRLRRPRRELTTRMLLLHTGGFGYEYFNADMAELRRVLGTPSVLTGQRRSVATPLLFDPGDRWEYGPGIDWAGLVVEAITGRRLGEVLAERLFVPLGMTSTRFGLTPAMAGRLADVHARARDGGFATRRFAPAADPEADLAGQGLFSTVADYVRFLRMWLDDGRAPDGSAILRPETVEMAARNGLGDPRVHTQPDLVPQVSGLADSFPGLSRSWGLSFMIEDEDRPTGRRAGSLSWAGAGNVYFWIDRRTGVAGIWAAQHLPFFDPPVIAAVAEFETAVYAHVR